MYRYKKYLEPRIVFFFSQSSSTRIIKLMPNILCFQGKMKVFIFCSQRVLFSGKQYKPKIFYFPLESLFAIHEYKNVFVHLFPERVQEKMVSGCDLTR